MAAHWKILIGLALGVIVGAIINAAWSDAAWAALGVRESAAFMAFTDDPDNDPTIVAHTVRFVAKLTTFIGDLFVRLLRFAAVPIVLFSLIAGVAGLGDPRQLGRLGAKAIALYVCTTVFAVVLGLLIADVVGPGRFVAPETRDQLLATSADEVALRASATGQIRGTWDQILRIVPQNPFEALVAADMLAVIFLAVAIGIGLTLVPRDRAAPAVGACAALGEALAIFVQIVMKTAPVAVFCLIAPIVAGLGLGVVKALAVFCLCVLAGLSLMLFVEYPLVVRYLGKASPRKFFRGIAPAQMVAFTTSSSSATLPVTLMCVTERLGVPKRVANFVLPLGATVNMDGTALYQGLTTVFVAQAFGLDLNFSQQLSIVLTATLASIGSPGIPSGGIVLLIAILQSANLPPQGIALILGVDRILDMCRTVINVSGDSMACVVIARAESGREDS